MLPNHKPEEFIVHFEIEINAPPCKVWAQMSSVEGMNKWLARTLVFEHKIGGQFSMQGRTPQGKFSFAGEVVRLDPEKEIAFTWTDNVDPWPATANTLVSIKLHPIPTGTRVSLTHSGFESLAEYAKLQYEGHIVGWEAAETLLELKNAVEAAG
jgi:uncharacterized protein YndB with AHSA1/START domain